MTRKPMPPSPRIMISAPFGCRISRIDFAAFLSSPGDMPSKMPTGLRSMAAILLPGRAYREFHHPYPAVPAAVPTSPLRGEVKFLEEMGELAAQELAARLLVVRRHELLDSLEPGVGERFGRLARRAQGLADHHQDPLAEPHIFRPR